MYLSHFKALFPPLALALCLPINSDTAGDTPVLSVSPRYGHIVIIDALIPQVCYFLCISWLRAAGGSPSVTCWSLRLQWDTLANRRLINTKVSVYGLCTLLQILVGFLLSSSCDLLDPWPLLPLSYLNAAEAKAGRHSSVLVTVSHRLKPWVWRFVFSRS